jgi:glutamate/tyrosine decarboxylase-like PLP-dependent enzyme
LSRSPLDLDLETMRRLGYRVSDIVAEHLASVRDEPVIASLPRRDLGRSLARAAPSEGKDFESIVSTLEESVFPYHAREPHPGFLAYIPSCPTFPAVLGDWIASGFNFFAGVWPVAAGPNELELVVLDWFREWMGMPDGSGGILTTGGSAATLTAVVAARHAAIEAGGDISRLTVYTSAQAHSSVIRAAWIAGIPRENVRTVDMDDGFRMVVSDLQRKVAADDVAGYTPFLVVASAGTTNTGAVDPLHEIADFCVGEKLWLHVDAAYAGFSVLTEEGKKLLSGIERADSLTLDPHKWLFVPFECGCLMVRDTSALASAFRIMPEYLKDVEPADEEVNFADRGEQLTRYSRALKIWLSVNYFGTAAIAGAIQESMERARLLEELIRAAPDFEVLSPAQFGIVCFRARPAGLDRASLDSLNERINARVVSEGRYLISSTRLEGSFSLRICTAGFRTTMDDIREFFEAIKRAFAIEAGTARTAAGQ